MSRYLNLLDHSGAEVSASARLIDGNTHNDMLSNVLLVGLGDLESKLAVNLKSLLKRKLDAARSHRLRLETLALGLNHQELAQLRHVVSLGGKLQGHGEVLPALLALGLPLGLGRGQVCLASDERRCEGEGRALEEGVVPERAIAGSD